MMELRDYLATRRTIPAKRMRDPGPDDGELMALLRIAARTPDHGKLAPWRFVVFAGEAREKAGALAAEHAPEGSDPATERARFCDAPVVVAVVSTAAPHPKIPEWEQVLSAGAVCMNLMHAAAAYGYAAQWLTGWPSYDEAILSALGIATGEKVAGFIHIGTPDAPPTERTRPELEAIVTRFS